MAVVRACREGAYGEGAYHKKGGISSRVPVVGACGEGACREGACEEGACEERACEEGACRKGACYKEGGISGRAGIRASFGKDTFRSFRLLFLLHRALSVVYSRGVDK